MKEKPEILALTVRHEEYSAIARCKSDKIYKHINKHWINLLTDERVGHRAIHKYPVVKVQELSTENIRYYEVAGIGIKPGNKGSGTDSKQMYFVITLGSRIA